MIVICRTVVTVFLIAITTCCCNSNNIVSATNTNTDNGVSNSTRNTIRPNLNSNMNDNAHHNVSASDFWGLSNNNMLVLEPSYDHYVYDSAYMVGGKDAYIDLTKLSFTIPHCNNNTDEKCFQYLTKLTIEHTVHATMDILFQASFGGSPGGFFHHDLLTNQPFGYSYVDVVIFPIPDHCAYRQQQKQQQQQQRKKQQHHLQTINRDNEFIITKNNKEQPKQQRKRKLQQEDLQCDWENFGIGKRVKSKISYEENKNSKNNSYRYNDYKNQLQICCNEYALRNNLCKEYGRLILDSVKFNKNKGMFNHRMAIPMIKKPAHQQQQAWDHDTTTTTNNNNKYSNNNPFNTDTTTTKWYIPESAGGIIPVSSSTTKHYVVFITNCNLLYGRELQIEGGGITYKSQYGYLPGELYVIYKFYILLSIIYSLAFIVIYAYYHNYYKTNSYNNTIGSKNNNDNNNYDNPVNIIATTTSTNTVATSYNRPFYILVEFWILLTVFFALLETVLISMNFYIWNNASWTSSLGGGSTTIILIGTLFGIIKNGLCRCLAIIVCKDGIVSAMTTTTTTTTSTSPPAADQSHSLSSISTSPTRTIMKKCDNKKCFIITLSMTYIGVTELVVILTSTIIQHLDRLDKTGAIVMIDFVNYLRIFKYVVDLLLIIWIFQSLRQIISYYTIHLLQYQQLQGKDNQYHHYNYYEQKLAKMKNAQTLFIGAVVLSGVVSIYTWFIRFKGWFYYIGILAPVAWVENVAYEVIYLYIILGIASISWLYQPNNVKRADVNYVLLLTDPSYSEKLLVDSNHHPLMLMEDNDHEHGFDDENQAGIEI